MGDDLRPLRIAVLVVGVLPLSGALVHDAAWPLVTRRVHIDPPSRLLGAARTPVTVEDATIGQAVLAALDGQASRAVLLAAVLLLALLLREAGKGTATHHSVVRRLRTIGLLLLLGGAVAGLADAVLHSALQEAITGTGDTPDGADVLYPSTPLGVAVLAVAAVVNVALRPGLSAPPATTAPAPPPPRS